MVSKFGLPQSANHLNKNSTSAVIFKSEKIWTAKISLKQTNMVGNGEIKDKTPSAL